MTITARDAVAGHGPEESVHSAGLLAEEVPRRIVSGGRLGDLIVRAGLDRVDQVGEADGVLDKEDGDVVADNVKVSFVSVEAGSEPVDIASGISTAAGTSNGREPDEDGSLLSSSTEEGSSRDVAPVGIAGEGTVSTGTTSVNSPFGNLISMSAHYMLPNLDT